MGHSLLVRVLLGSAGLAGCLALLSGVARAADSTDVNQQPIIVSRVVQPVPPALFGTVTLPIRPARYLDDWERARRDASNVPQMQALIAPARALSRGQQIYFVQAAVHRAIRWRSDATEWGLHDYWASAQETLQHGFGDMEDRAIVKMQALRALGFSTRDLYLTMGYDMVGGPITVLIVRYDGQFYVLDDTGGTPYPTNRRPEFTPSLTFGYGGSWIHGYPARTREFRTAASGVAAAAH
jgi:predicted transglutaminase-like cysteine proteinase